MKKILLGLGSITAIAAPIATVVSCGSKTQYVTTPAVGADGATHNYLSGAQASVMKGMLHKVYPSIQSDDIKAVELLRNGYSLKTGLTSADSDYAIRFVFNKTVSVELGDYNKVMRENGELIFSAYNVDGRIVTIVKNPNTQFTQQVVTGSAKNMIIAALNSNDMAFTVPAPVATVPIHTPEVRHFDFTDELLKFNAVIGDDHEFISKRSKGFFLLSLSTSTSDLSLDELGLPRIDFYAGVTFSAQIISNKDDTFLVTATLTRGIDNVKINFTIIADSKK